MTFPTVRLQKPFVSKGLLSCLEVEGPSRPARKTHGSLPSRRRSKEDPPPAGNRFRNGSVYPLGEPLRPPVLLARTTCRWNRGASAIPSFHALARRVIRIELTSVVLPTLGPASMYGFSPTQLPAPCRSCISAPLGWCSRCGCDA
jgi:hypothetical protein